MLTGNLNRAPEHGACLLCHVSCLSGESKVRCCQMSVPFPLAFYTCSVLACLQWYGISPSGLHTECQRGFFHEVTESVSLHSISWCLTSGRIYLPSEMNSLLELTLVFLEDLLAVSPLLSVVMWLKLNTVRRSSCALGHAST